MASKSLVRPKGINEPQRDMQSTDKVAATIERAEAKRRAELEARYARMLGKAVTGTLTEKQAEGLVDLVGQLGTSVRHFRQQTQELVDAIAKHKLIGEWWSGDGEKHFRELTAQRQRLLEEKKQALADFDDKIRRTDYEKSKYLQRRQTVKESEAWLRELRQSPGFAEAAKACGFDELLTDPEASAKPKAKPEPEPDE